MLEFVTASTLEVAVAASFAGRLKPSPIVMAKTNGDARMFAVLWLVNCELALDSTINYFKQEVPTI